MFDQNDKVDNYFKIVCEGISKEDKSPSTVYFQSEKCYNLYIANELDFNLGLTLTPNMAGKLEEEKADKMLVFWFDNSESKQDWIKKNLTLA